jgi:hypothetical protein
MFLCVCIFVCAIKVSLDIFRYIRVCVCVCIRSHDLQRTRDVCMKLILPSHVGMMPTSSHDSHFRHTIQPQMAGIAPLIYSVISASLCYIVRVTRPNAKGRNALLYLSEMILFAAPAVLVGVMDSIQARSAILWSFSAPLLHANLRPSATAAPIAWMGAYAGMAIGMHTIIGAF